MKMARTEKVYQADQIDSEILTKWEKEVGLKHQFWGYLSKEIVDRKEF